MVDKYFDLVWYARKPRFDGEVPTMAEAKEAMPGTPVDILEGMVDQMQRVEELYPEAVGDLNAEDGDWCHGFNSGVLAALRFVYQAEFDSVEEAKAEWPKLDT